MKIESFKVPAEMPFGYMVFLVLYVLQKEAKRWLDHEQKKRRGEVYFFIWWSTWLLMLITEFLQPNDFDVPVKMLETCVFVSVPFVVTAVSKLFHEAYRSRGIAQGHGSKKHATVLHGK